VAAGVALLSSGDPDTVPSECRRTARRSTPPATPGSAAERPGSSRRLGYGEAVQLAGVVCVSRETGVRCENRTTLHGFSISRTAYELF
jgi:hypothetical protein